MGEQFQHDGGSPGKGVATAGCGIDGAVILGKPTFFDQGQAVVVDFFLVLEVALSIESSIYAVVVGKANSFDEFETKLVHLVSPVLG